MEDEALQQILEAGKLGYYSIRGKDCEIILEPRPAYCDRGNWLAKVFVDPGKEIDLWIDNADGWPRYYFSLMNALDECKSWLEKRGQWVTNEWQHKQVEE